MNDMYQLFAGTKSFRMAYYKIENAGLAHLVERHLAKVEVASSSLVTRSKKTWGAFVPSRFIWRHSQVVRQRSATPLSPVRFRLSPLLESQKCGSFFVAVHALSYPS